MQNEYRSKEEIYFSWWLDELIDSGHLLKYEYEQDSYVMSQKKTYTYIKQLKTKAKTLSSTLLNEHRYTPDFVLYWNQEKSKLPFLKDVDGSTKIDNHDLIYQRPTEPFSVIDVKGTFNRHRGDQEFSINQKWTYDKYGIYVNKVVPQKLFKHTFTPVRYLKTDSGTQDRKIKWDVVFLEEVI